jgi:low temperature requirement protein LtrA
VVMRVAMIVQWLRAATADPERRVTALRYAAGIGVVQVGWLLRLLLSGAGSDVASVLLVCAELVVPLVAERGAMTTWHPHHIAERYGLLTIIVLGESVLGVSVAIAAQVGDHPLQPDLLLVAGGGLVLVFALWWVYFLKPAARTLEQRRDWAFAWGYGHYGVFASLAALGAGLEVAAVRALHPVAASDPAIAWAVGIPVAVFLVLIWLLHLPTSPAPTRQGLTVGVLALLSLAPAVGCGLGLPLPWAVTATALPPVLLVTLGVIRRTAAP